MAGDAGSNRVTVRNPHHPDWSSTVDGPRYRAMEVAVLAVTPSTAPGISQNEMRAAVLPHLPDSLFPGGAKADWWSKAVQLNLEADGVLVREPGTPLRWHRAG